MFYILRTLHILSYYTSHFLLPIRRTFPCSRHDIPQYTSHIPNSIQYSIRSTIRSLLFFFFFLIFSFVNPFYPTRIERRNLQNIRRKKFMGYCEIYYEIRDHKFSTKIFIPQNVNIVDRKFPTKTPGQLSVDSGIKYIMGKYIVK